MVPGHRDWICLALAGQDGVSPKVCGTYNADTAYEHLNIIALNGGSFIAKCDDPGACPGDGWQLLTSPGRAGKPGEPGPKGERGLKGDKGVRGEAGLSIVAWEVDRSMFHALPVMSDGSKGPVLELRMLFEQFQIEAR
jgi:hypothetical protein